MSGKNPFEDSNDDMAAAFLNSNPKYLAADKLPMSPQEKAVAEATERRDQLLRQMREVEQRTLDSSKSSVRMLMESEKVGIETAQDLSHQREQLDNTGKRLDEINSSLKDTQKNINGIKSAFYSLKQWWGKPKKGSESADKNPLSSPPTSPSDSGAAPTLSQNLSSAVETSEFALNSSSKSHPALQLRGLEEEEEEELNDPRSPDDFRANSQRVNKQLDADLDDMSAGLSRLSSLAKGLGNEIEDQNQMLDSIQNKAVKADVTLGSQTKQMNKILNNPEKKSQTGAMDGPSKLAAAKMILK